MRELLELRLGGVGHVALAALVVIPFVALGTAVAARSGRVRGHLTPSRRSLCTDLGYALLSPLTEVLSRVLATLAIAGCALVAGLRVGPELLRGFGPVVAQPRWLVIVEMLVLGDLAYYWTHRLAHTVPWLWRLHAVHHSTTHMRWTSALRAHPAEAYAHVLHVVPLFLLGFPIEGLVGVVPIATLYALLIHSDLELRLGPLRYVLNGPAFHRWHHARDVRDGGTNFAGLFPVYDVIFGTYALPEHRPPALGIDVSDVPQGCLAQLAWPFRSRPSPATIGGRVEWRLARERSSAWTAQLRRHATSLFPLARGQRPA